MRFSEFKAENDPFEGQNFERAPHIWSTRVELDFFRHDEKEKNHPQGDEFVELTQDGKKHALTVGREKGASDQNITYAIAFGSDRARAQQTAIYHMAGGLDDITGDETPQELKEKINKSIKIGSKIHVDNRLNFKINWGSQYGAKVMAALKEGRYFKFLVEESDELAKLLNEKESSTYSSQAAGVASILGKYVKVARNFEKIHMAANAKEKRTDTLKRYFGSHQGVLESFLAKVIGAVKGREKRDEFVRALDNQGFDFSEGFKINVLNMPSEKHPRIHVSYKKEKEKEGERPFTFDEDVSLDVIEKIAEKGLINEK